VATVSQQRDQIITSLRDAAGDTTLHHSEPTRLWAQAHTEGQAPLGSVDDLEKARATRQELEDGSAQLQDWPGISPG